MNPLLDLSDRIVDEFGERLASAPRITHDALILDLDNGVSLEVRAASPSEYAFTWQASELTLRIDTAPMHPQLATFPHHLHDRHGSPCADPLTDPGRPLWENVHAVVARLLIEPSL